MTPALSLAYLFWTRRRRGLILLGCYWLAAMILCCALPAGALGFDADDPSLALVASILLYGGLLAALGYLLLLFSFSWEVRLEACESGLPARLWTLPLPTSALVGWPMIWGSVTMVLGWAMLAWAARRPYSYDVPLLWPGLLLAVVLAWLQALVWTPLPLPWVRAFFFLPLTGILVAMPIVIVAAGIPSLLACGLLAVLLMAAYLTALRGAARARRGDNVQWDWPSWLRWPRAARRSSQPFTSAAQAQLWFEWRFQGRAFPVMMAACAAVFLPMMRYFADVVVERGPSLLQELGSLWLAVAFASIVPALFAGEFGAQMGMFGRSYHLPPFLATRPVSEAMLVRAKFESAAWSTLSGWGVLAAGLLLWSVFGGYVGEMARQFEAMRRQHTPGVFWGWLALLAGGAVGLTWLRIVQGMWAGLSGGERVIVRSRLVSFVPIALMTFLGLWLLDHPEHRPDWSGVGRLLPWLTGAAIVLKTVAAIWSLHELRRRKLIASGLLRRLLAIWLVLAAGLFAALYMLLPDDWFSLSGVVLAIVLLLPLTRLALAPIALTWNRHR